MVLVRYVTPKISPSVTASMDSRLIFCFLLMTVVPNVVHCYHLSGIPRYNHLTLSSFVSPKRTSIALHSQRQFSHIMMLPSDKGYPPQAQSRRRIRVISCDVTGTLISFQGKLEDHYGNAARECGIEIPPEKESLIRTSFYQAYQETCHSHPCFGHVSISSKEWWRRCVLRSFELVGVSMTALEKERVFQRVYSLFGSHTAYMAFPDVIPFLKWCHRRGIVCGVISNADERYGDSILPMLGIGETLQFLTFSKNVGYEKPNTKKYQAAVLEAEPWLCLEKSGLVSASPLLPEEILHIGNDFKKDYMGAKAAGFNAILLDRFDEKERTGVWRANGARVFKDLIDVVEYLGREQVELGSSECVLTTEESYQV